MKKMMLVSLTAIALAAGGGVFATPLVGSSNFALGVVQQVDRAAGTANVAHEPVASLNWPAMTMQFAVGEAALFDRLPAGRQVAFEFVGADGGYRIVNAIPLEQAGGAPAAGAQHKGMHGGMMGGGMSDMHRMCEDMMGGGMHGRKP